MASNEEIIFLVTKIISPLPSFLPEPKTLPMTTPRNTNVKINVFFTRSSNMWLLYILSCILSIYFPKYLQKFSGFIAHNVPAVCDGLAARISVCAANAGPTNCAGAMAWE
jgi:hypothetical protein